jgi:hypothetical protein
MTLRLSKAIARAWAEVRSTWSWRLSWASLHLLLRQLSNGGAEPRNHILHPGWAGMQWGTRLWGRPQAVATRPMHASCPSKLDDLSERAERVSAGCQPLLHKSDTGPSMPCKRRLGMCLWIRAPQQWHSIPHGADWIQCIQSRHTSMCHARRIHDHHWKSPRGGWIGRN